MDVTDDSMRIAYLRCANHGLLAEHGRAVREVARGGSGIATTLFLTERAVEKHINAIFSKLELSEEPDAHRRVKAALVYLAAQH